MDFWYLKFTAILVFVERICSLPLACPYNGTTYGEGETVRTEDPCLFCTCRSGTLECSLRVCADHPNGLPPGCFFLHKPNECCPQLFCEDGSFNPIEIELRTDYKLENKLNRNDCTINGSIYAEGSAVASPRVCEYCYCVEGEIKCLKPRCLQSFDGCKAIFERSSCCPTHYDCRDADVNLLRLQIQNFVLASDDANGTNESLRTFPDFVEKSLKTNFNESEFVENSTGKGTEEREEFGMMTTTSETNAEGTTVTPEKETTTPEEEEEDSLTSFGFQTTRSETFNDEPTEVESTEVTSSAPEASTLAEEEDLETSSVRIPAKSNFSETIESPATSIHENHNDSSQAMEAKDDYDSYDYGEPQLPPSLPNLVIFPFVAADAVVKDDAAAVLDVRDKIEIKRVDSHPDFYKDYFSPPAKTEGGFVPKESFYERDYFKEDQIESPGADQKAGVPCQSIACPPLTSGHQWTSVVSVAGDLKNGKPGQLEENVKPPTDFIIKDESPTFQKSQQTKKPVTVTYKHVVVDFYPKYLITTTRARPKIQPGESTQSEIRPIGGGGFRDSTQKIPIPVSNSATETVFGFVQEIISPSPPKRTPETPTAAPVQTASSITATTVESSFFDEFFNSFLSEEITTTMTTTTTNAKQKYSSKIKGHADSITAKPLRGDGFDQKVNTDVGDRISSTESSSLPMALSNSKGFSKTSSFHSSATSAPAEINSEAGQKFAPSRRNENLWEESTNQGSGGHGSMAESDVSVGGAILKLAGCNIYGMMYRVGKVITELSGPCLECLCTELGVQCRPLKC